MNWINDIIKDSSSEPQILDNRLKGFSKGHAASLDSVLPRILF